VRCAQLFFHISFQQWPAHAIRSDDVSAGRKKRTYLSDVVGNVFIATKNLSLKILEKMREVLGMLIISYLTQEMEPQQ
jgi:hypothetical protein